MARGCVVSELLDGKRVVVTGGAGLLGRHFCRMIAKHDGLAIVADRDLKASEEVARQICAEYPAGAVPCELDITSAISIDSLIEKIDRDYGQIHAVINNAYPKNARYGRKVEEVSYEDFCENLGMHLGGYFLMMQRFAAYFERQDGGNIINMSSIYGSMAPRFSLYEGTSMTMPVEYAATKSGVEHLTRYFAQYLKGRNIRVNSLSPGGILDSQPQVFLEAYRSHCSTQGMLNPEDLMGSLLYLLSDWSRHVVGQNLIVDDGFSL